MNEKKYFEIPARGEVYEVTPDCCFTVVKYEGSHPDIALRVDDPANELNSSDLECYCHPRIQIVPISAERYKEKYTFVIGIKEQRAA